MTRTTIFLSLTLCTAVSVSAGRVPLTETRVTRPTKLERLPTPTVQDIGEGNQPQPFVTLVREGFDGTKFPPSEWSEQCYGPDCDSWQRTTGSRQPPGVIPYEGEGIAEYDVYSSRRLSGCRLITPVFDPAGREAHVTFQFLRSYSMYTFADSLFVEYRQDSGAWQRIGALSPYANSGHPYWSGLDFSIPALSGAVEVAFNALSGFGLNNIYIDKVLIYARSANDFAGVGLVDAPEFVRAESAVAFVGTVHNFGTASVGAGVRVGLSITGPNSYVYSDTDQTTTRTLNQGESQNITFMPDWSVPAIGGQYTVKVWTALTGDDDPGNDTFTATVTVCAGLYESFTERSFPPFRWTEGAIQNNYHWQRDASYPRSWSGCAVYPSYEAEPGSGAYLQTPRLDLTASANDSIVFYWLHPYFLLPAEDFLEVYVSTDLGAGWTLLGTQTGIRSSWQRVAYSLEGVGQTDECYVRFVARSRSGENLYIDDVLGPEVVTADVDMAMMTIRAPSDRVTNGAVITPMARIINMGTTAQSSVPVSCRIDSMGVNIYHEQVVYPGTVPPGSDAFVLFPAWRAGRGPFYEVAMSTNLSGDQNRSNDTLRRSCRSVLWSALNAPTTTPDRLTHATVYDSVGDRIYMIGGTPDGSPGSNVNLNQAYNPNSNMWQNLSPMPTPRGWLKGSRVKDCIYVIGGLGNTGSALATNEAYSIAENSWKTCAPSPRPRIAHLEVVWRDSLIYVMGGTADGQTGLTNVDIYDPANDDWRAGTALQFQADMGDAVCIGDTIYIPEAYNRGANAPWHNLYKGAINPQDPSDIKWIEGPVLPVPTMLAGVTALAGKVFWLGGLEPGGHWSDKLWCYDRERDVIDTVTGFSYLATLSRNCYLTARPSTGELYVIAGDSGGDWASPNRIYARARLTMTGAVTEPSGSPVVPFSLSAPKPNPFALQTSISYTLPNEAQVSVGIFGIDGRLVRNLRPGRQTAGRYVLPLSLAPLAKGVYYCRLNAGEHSATVKLVKTE